MAADVIFMSELAELYGFSYVAMANKVKRGGLKPIKSDGYRLHFDRKEALEWMAKQKLAPKHLRTAWADPKRFRPPYNREVYFEIDGHVVVGRMTIMGEYIVIENGGVRTVTPDRWRDIKNGL